MSEKTLKKSEVLAINAILARISKDGTEEAPTKLSRRFAYGIAKNSRRIKDEVESIQEAMKPVSEYEQKRIDLCKKYADKDDEGNPILKDNVYQGLRDNEEFRKEIDALSDEYEKSIEGVNTILSEETAIDFYEIPLDDFPEQISVGEMEVLLPLVKEE
ncbi:MAG: hypothetical protein GF334_00145 [Candidatus Altiarchaeales archaeon]|nr:hypothetical protein [Candidatus Altiarchaeales archaeon]